MLTRGHTTRVIFTVKICNFSDRTRKVISRKLKYIFTKKKTAPQLLGDIGLQNMKVGEKRVLSY